jgi:hypothetical protein
VHAASLFFGTRQRVGVQGIALDSVVLSHRPRKRAILDETRVPPDQGVGMVVDQEGGSPLFRPIEDWL